MTKAKCYKCGGSAIADTFEKARTLINHAVGLSRGTKCGDSYNKVIEIKDSKVTIPEKPILEKEVPIKDKPVEKSTAPEKEKSKIKKQKNENLSDKKSVNTSKEKYL